MICAAAPRAPRRHRGATAVLRHCCVIGLACLLTLPVVAADSVRGTLDRWLADPESLIPGQRMGYRVDDARDRADLIEYLSTLQ